MDRPDLSYQKAPSIIGHRVPVYGALTQELLKMCRGKAVEEYRPLQKGLKKPDLDQVWRVVEMCPVGLDNYSSLGNVIFGYRFPKRYTSRHVS